MTRRFWKNFGLITACNVLTPFFAVVLVLAISRLSGPELLGKYSLMMAVFILGQSCASLGLTVVITRETARDRARAGDYFVGACLVGLVAVAVALAAALPPVWWLVRDGDLRLGLAVVLCALLPSVVSIHAEAVLLGLEDSRPFVVVALVERSIATLLSTAVVFLGYGIVAIAWLTLLARLGASASLLQMLRRRGVALVAVDRDLVRGLMRGLPVLASIPIVNAVHSRLDVIALSALRGFADVGVYSAAARLVDVARIIPMAYARAIYPLVSRLQAGDRGELIRTFREANRALLLITCLVAIGLAGTADFVIELLYGPAFRNASDVLKLLAWSVVPFGIASVFAQMLFASNLAVLDLRVNAIAVVTNGALSVFLVPRWGAHGAAVATLVSGTLYAALQYFYVASRVSKPSLLGVFARIGLAAAAGWIAVQAAVYVAFPPIVAATAALVVYVIVLLGSGSVSRQDLAATHALLASSGSSR